MTVTATSYTPITYNGNGSTTVFNVTFQFYEIAVIHIDSSGSETEWTENTHYTVTGGEGSTGSITVTTTAPATGEKLRIERRTSKDQPRDYDLDNAVLEAALQQSDDRLAMILQELDYDNRRRPAISTANFTAEVEFPTASTGNVLSWGSDGNLANTALVDLDGVAISALTTTTSLEDTDLLPLYDNSAGDNAAITWANVKTAVSTALNLGALAVLDELPDNSVTSGKVANGSITSDKLADNIRISGTFGIGDSYPVYVYRTSGGADTDWKNIADITIDTGAYAAVSLQVEVINPHSNFGSKVDLDRHIFTVSARRSGATQDSYNDGLIAGPYADWVRLVKTSTGVYQLQVRQYANNKHIEFSCKVTSLLKANVSYNKSPSNGSTTGDIYTVTEPDPYHGSSIDKTRIPLKYMKFEGTTGSIHYETGFATLTRTGTGRYTCTFDAPEPDTNYEVWCDLECGTHTLPFRFDARARNYTTTGFEIVVGEQNESTWSYKDELVFVQVYRRA